MSGPYGPNETPGPDQGRNDPIQQWGQQPGAPQPQQPDPQQWGADQGGQQQWGQQPQPQQDWGPQAQQQPQWGQPQPQPQWPQPQPQPQAQPQPQPQWGQGQPQPQQWGQQPQWGQPGQAQGGGPKTGLVIGIVGLGVVVIGIVLVLVFALTAKDELDQNALQGGVQQVLSDSYGIQDVTGVSCPEGHDVEVGSTFTCSLQVSGEAKEVSVEITKDDGTYEVGRPT